MVKVCEIEFYGKSCWYWLVILYIYKSYFFLFSLWGVFDRLVLIELY